MQNLRSSARRQRHNWSKARDVREAGLRRWGRHRCAHWKARPSPDGMLHPFNGETDIFITPGYRFLATDMLLTNFHLPRSTLFMLVSAFVGLEVMKRAYLEAIAQGYRFYSYGDACLLLRAP